MGILVRGKSNMAAQNKMADEIGKLMHLTSGRFGKILHKYMMQLTKKLITKKEF